MSNDTQTVPPEALPHLAIFTDFDGTLVDLADTPDGIEVPATLPLQIEQAAEKFDHAFAVVTGRMIEDIDRYLGAPPLAVAGSHGAQRRKADGTLIELPAEFRNAAEIIAEQLAPLLQAHEGLLLERKDATVALHFRQLPELDAACEEAISAAVAAVPDFVVVPGKMVFEARPVGISKGEAVRAFMNEEPFVGRTPIFIGDDLTDEDGFRAVQELGGVGIKLGPGDTEARMRIADVASVRALILGLADRETNIA
ncbi:MAG TPA: trehalose-phosphatase [Devosiaceae bacterium]